MTATNAKLFVRGNTYPVKEDLKKLGFRWDGVEYTWFVFDGPGAQDKLAQGQALVDAAGPKRQWQGAPGAPLAPRSGVTTAPEAINRVSTGSVAGERAVVDLPPGVVWSDEQLAIFNEVKTGTGNVVVKALAGTGKTFTIVYALPLFAGERGCYVVFNTKNKEEAKRKVTDPRCDVRNHNGFGYMFVRQVWPKAKPDDDVEFDRAERVVGKDTAQEVKVAVVKLVGFLKNCYVQPTLEQAVDTAQERSIEAAGFEQPQDGGWDVTKLAKSALKVLELSLEPEADGRISFNDQVWLAVRKNWVRAWFDYLVVDETQDMNAVQLEMVQRAVKPGGRLMIVGDENQCIYAFRGAEMDGMDKMTRELSAKTLTLSVTRRCAKAIVREAQKFVPHYQAHQDAPEGSVESIAEANLPDVVKPGDAILSRANAPLMSLCLRLLKQGTPARIQGRDIGKALAATVRKLRAKTVPDFLRRLEAWANKQRARYKGLKCEESKCEEIRDVRETLEAVADGAASVTEITDRLERLFADSADKPQVVLSSVHKAKGLEWERVYLIRRTFNRKQKPGQWNAVGSGIAQNLRTALPAEREERNIQYVAITRAKKTLVWCEEVRGEGRG